VEAYVQGPPAETEAATLERLPTLIDAVLLGAEGQSLGTVVDAAFELRTGRIRHYLAARSDPRLPGSSRWRLSPDRITDQLPGRVFTALAEIDDLPLARASVRQQLLRRSRRWREQVDSEAARLREQFQEAGGRFEERLEGWLEETPWEPERPRREDPAWRGPDPLENWEEEVPRPPRHRPPVETEDDPWV